MKHHLLFKYSLVAFLLCSCNNIQDYSGQYFLASSNHQDLGTGYKLNLKNDRTYTFTNTSPIFETVENIKTGEQHNELTTLTASCSGNYFIENKKLFSKIIVS